MLVASMTLLRLRLNTIATKWRALMEIAGNPYRPELYYMRGPGPKWHAKHRLLGGSLEAQRRRPVAHFPEGNQAVSGYQTQTEQRSQGSPT